MVAGHETSANMLSWCPYIMVIRPDLQDRLRNEVRELIEKSTGEPKFSEIDALPFLESLIKESLRIYPSSESST